MKLHKDGTLEGTTEEIAEFMKLKDPMFGKMYMPLGTKKENPFIAPSVTTSVASPVGDNIRYQSQGSIGYSQAQTDHVKNSV